MITVFTGIVIALVFLAINETMRQHYLKKIAKQMDLLEFIQNRTISMTKALEQRKEDGEDWQAVIEARKSIERYQAAPSGLKA